MPSRSQPIAIIGTGPAGLMAAYVAAKAGHPVRLFERRKAAGRKLLIAGSSGLNVTYDAQAPEFAAFYEAPDPGRARLAAQLAAFSPTDWLQFLQALGLETFKGTSRRYFVKEMKASGLLQAWLRELDRLGAQLSYDHECVDFTTLPGGRARLTFAGGAEFECAAACFALGGGSWEDEAVRWPALFTHKQIAFRDFVATNVGYEVDWPAAFLAEAEQQPLKGVALTSSKGRKLGDAMITRYGIEGTPVYFVGETGEVRLDLKPDLTVEQIVKKLSASAENRSALRRAKKYLNLSPAALALLTHVNPPLDGERLAAFAARVKSFPIFLRSPRPLAEAISSAGGLAWDEFDERLMLRRHPGIFAAGEMLDWSAPTGGFLIQACVSQGVVAARGMIDYCAKLDC